MKYIFQNASSLYPCSQVQDRIMKLWWDGSISGDLAMQLLGSGTKKASEQATSVTPVQQGSENDSDKSGEKRPASDALSTQPDELDEVLQQAKKAKMDFRLA